VQNDMIANVQAGSKKWTIHGDWEQRGPRVWRFVEP